MSLDFNNFIGVERHYKQVEHGAKEVRDKYAPRPSESRRYLLDLFDFFSNDIKKAADVIYAEVLHKKDSLGDKFNFTASDLKGCIENGTHSLLPLYNRIITGYNMGCMFRDVDDFDKLMVSFDGDAKALCIKQAEAIEIKYRKLVAKNRRENWTFNWAVVAAITGIASIVGFKINLNWEAGLSFIKIAARSLAAIFCFC